MNNDFTKLYKKQFSSPRSGFFYNLYSYPTKISPETIALYIATHTEPGSLILDMFGGSGSTAIASLLCSKPTERMITQANELGIKPNWGERNCSIYDVSVFGTFATKTMTSGLTKEEFEKVSASFLRASREKFGNIYQIKDDEGNIGEMRHIVWSDVLICPHCTNKFKYVDCFVKENPIEFLDSGSCLHCGKRGGSKDFSHSFIFSNDKFLNEEIEIRERVPAIIYGKTGKRNWKRIANEEDIRIMTEIDDLPIPNDIKPQKIVWGDLYRAGYHKGIKYLHQFYTKRNFYVFSNMWNLINEYPKKYRDALKLLMLSYNQSHATLMSRVVAKKNQNDFVVTGAQPGVLYISNLPLEKNILSGLERKIQIFAKTFGHLQTTKGTVKVYTQSSEQMIEENSSVDYIFTDPPFGDFIPYSEINQINELWLGETTATDSEAIISSYQGKGVKEYGVLMKNIFREGNRVLKNEGIMNLVFHSSSKDVWNELLDTIQHSNFEVENSTFLLKGQTSFKQGISSGGVIDDSLFLLKKSSNHNFVTTNFNFQNFISTNYKSLDSNKKKLYSQYINESVIQYNKIALDSVSFYRKVEEFINEK